MLTIDDIRFLHIELTTRCNARCPMCMRNFKGYPHNFGYPLTELSLSDIKQILSKNFLQQLTYINFNGNLGDFSNAKDAISIVNYVIKHSQANVQIETNGSTNTAEWWEQLAHPRIDIYFALDGLEDTHNLYRLDTNWNKVLENAKAVIRAGGNAIWKFIEFDHNKHQISDCENMSKSLGFKSFEVVDQGRNQGPVYTRKGEFSHWIGNPFINKLTVNQDLDQHHNWFDNTDFDWLDQTCDISCRHKNKKEIYIAADGSVYPCCWTGFYPTTMFLPGNSQIKDLVVKNNALQYTLNECISWFDSLEKQWELPDIASGKPFLCLQNCSKK